MNSASAVSSACKPRLVLNCIGTAHYSAVAIGRTLKDIKTNGVNIVIRGMQLDITRRTKLRTDYRILHADCASLI